jgi:hypothetical protein
VIRGNVVLVAERGIRIRIKTGSSVVYSSGLMETITSPRVGGDSPDPSSGRGMQQISADFVVRENRRCC